MSSENRTWHRTAVLGAALLVLLMGTSSLWQDSNTARRYSFEDQRRLQLLPIELPFNLPIPSLCRNVITVPSRCEQGGIELEDGIPSAPVNIASSSSQSFCLRDLADNPHVTCKATSSTNPEGLTLRLSFDDFDVLCEDSSPDDEARFCSVQAFGTSELQAKIRVTDEDAQNVRVTCTVEGAAECPSDTTLLADGVPTSPIRLTANTVAQYCWPLGASNQNVDCISYTLETNDTEVTEPNYQLGLKWGDVGDEAEACLDRIEDGKEVLECGLEPSAATLAEVFLIGLGLSENLVILCTSGTET